MQWLDLSLSHSHGTKDKNCVVENIENHAKLHQPAFLRDFGNATKSVKVNSRGIVLVVLCVVECFGCGEFRNLSLTLQQKHPIICLIKAVIIVTFAILIRMNCCAQTIIVVAY
jgi:hypothetical protein